jgi:hypothetical protein
MSLEYLNAALNLPMEDSSAKAVLIGLANHTSPEGECWPGVRRLQLYTALCERTVRASIKRLEALGLLEVTRRDHTTSLYKLKLSIHQMQPAVQLMHKGGAADAGGGAAAAGGGAANAPKPLLNPQITDASDARVFDEDWKPSPATVEALTSKQGLSAGQIERERFMFVLKAMAGTIPTKPDAAFKAWCARLPSLNHQPKNSIETAAPSAEWAAKSRIDKLRELAAFKRKINRIQDAEELEQEIVAMEWASARIRERVAHSTPT